VAATAATRAPKVEAEHGMASINEAVGDRDHQRSIHRPTLQRMGVTEHREAFGVIRGINPRLQRFPI
jgi:hypothetical protein